VYNERINLNQVVALATGGTGVDQPILISDIDVVVTNDYSNGTTAGIYVGGRANVTIENVDIVVNSTNGLGGHESGLFYRQSNNWAEISDLTVNNVNASVQGWQARGVYIEHGGYYNVLEAANISITNSNFSATGSVLGEGLYWTGGQLDLIDTNLFSGNTASIYVNDANGAIISNSTLIGIIDNASADIVLSNCVDGSGNPL
ncbi:MAG: hypothetical protein OET90_10310, partial [Desulfuromonadales bacterium]|nr:hypothetical protein [Desulfuromonadales bacterium]